MEAGVTAQDLYGYVPDKVPLVQVRICEVQVLPEEDWYAVMLLPSATVVALNVQEADDDIGVEIGDVTVTLAPPESPDPLDPVPDDDTEVITGVVTAMVVESPDPPVLVDPLELVAKDELPFAARSAASLAWSTFTCAMSVWMSIAKLAEVVV